MIAWLNALGNLGPAMLAITGSSIHAPLPLQEPVVEARQEKQDDKTQDANDQQERTKIQNLIDRLNEVLTKTDSASVKVDHAYKIIEEYRKQLDKKDEADAKSVKEATASLMGALKQSLDRLRQDATAIKQDIEQVVVPYLDENIAMLEAKLRIIDKADQAREEWKALHETAVRQRQEIVHNAGRLGENIRALDIARGLVGDRLELAQMWRNMEDTAQSLIDKLEEFNSKIEKIVDALPKPQG